jgi:DNA repair protein RadB
VKAMDDPIATGWDSLNNILGGGLKPCGIILIYGEAETGKTTIAMQCAVNSVRKGFKVLYIDSDRSFSPERLFQIEFNNQNLSDSIIIARPSTFNEQIELVDNLEKYLNKRFGLIVFDTVTSLYRSTFLDKKENFYLNRELNRQVATLTQLAKTLELSLVLISQVRSKMSEDSFTSVATRVLNYWCDTIIRLSRTSRKNIIRATIEKVEGKQTKIILYLILDEDGIHDYKP